MKYSRNCKQFSMKCVTSLLASKVYLIETYTLSDNRKISFQLLLLKYIMKFSLFLLIILLFQSSIQNISPRYLLVETKEHDEGRENPGKTKFFSSQKLLIKYHNIILMHECGN